MPTKTTSRLKAVPRLRGQVPAFMRPFATIINALADFAGANRPLAGKGVVIQEAQQGAVVQLDDKVLQMLQDYLNAKAGNTGDVDNEGNPRPGNPFQPGTTGGGDSGTPTDPDGNPLPFQTRYVCVSDGAGGWTPMLEDYYASDPYAP